MNAKIESVRDVPFATAAIDIFESDRDFRVDVDLPGVRAEDVQLQLEGGELRLEATRSTEASNLRYRRSIRFDTPLDASAVTARLEAGVLGLTLPKAREALPRTIPVTVG